MIKVFLSLLLSGLIFSSCSKEEQAPEALQALTKNTNCTCEPYVNQYLWKGKTVYVLAYKGPYCTWTAGYYDENGTKTDMEAGYSYYTFLDESQLIKNIWTCKAGT